MDPIIDFRAVVGPVDIHSVSVCVL